ncbi:hypothetical protein C6503_14505 [Candidatus Poribacteria bacterium]|nr:MAG: hypothetical protein C6503_14505 [Candidatus Poribacteria bacterium]
MKKFQSAFSMMRWFDAQGGHLETKGISPEGKVIEVPLHRHHVKLNIFRIDIGLKYQFNSEWMLEANVPYETKIQEATIEEIDTLTDAQRKAIERNRDNHHRNETYIGLTDSDIFLGYQRQGVFVDHDFLVGRIGTTIPLGKTEEDPWKLGDAGLKHLHIQFGTGTFNPIADLHYGLPLYKGLRANVSIRGKLPFYENSKTYRGSREVTYTGGLNYRLNDWLSFQAGYLGFYQSFAYWAGEQDINSGLRFSMACFGASGITPYNVPLSLTVMLPLQQETLYDDTDALLDGAYGERDAFEFGPLVSLTALYAF